MKEEAIKNLKAFKKSEELRKEIAQDGGEWYGFTEAPIVTGDEETKRTSFVTILSGALFRVQE